MEAREEARSDSPWATFYTAGEPEAHAWSLRRGESVLEAAAGRAGTVAQEQRSEPDHVG